MRHMIEDTAAASLSFTTTELSKLNAAIAKIEVRGQRLPDAVLAFSGVDAPSPKK